VFIYPGAAHQPCGHVCAQKKKCGTTYQLAPTTTNNFNNPSSSITHTIHDTWPLLPLPPSPLAATTCNRCWWPTTTLAHPDTTKTMCRCHVSKWTRPVRSCNVTMMMGHHLTVMTHGVITVDISLWLCQLRWVSTTLSPHSSCWQWIQVAHCQQRHGNQMTNDDWFIIHYCHQLTTAWWQQQHNNNKNGHAMTSVAAASQWPAPPPLSSPTALELHSTHTSHPTLLPLHMTTLHNNGGRSHNPATTEWQHMTTMGNNNGHGTQSVLVILWASGMFLDVDFLFFTNKFEFFLRTTILLPYGCHVTQHHHPTCKPLLIGGNGCADDEWYHNTAVSTCLQSDVIS